MFFSFFAMFFCWLWLGTQFIAVNSSRFNGHLSTSESLFFLFGNTQPSSTLKTLPKLMDKCAREQKNANDIKSRRFSRVNLIYFIYVADFERESFHFQGESEKNVFHFFWSFLHVITCVGFYLGRFDTLLGGTIIELFWEGLDKNEAWITSIMRKNEVSLLSDKLQQFFLSPKLQISQIFWLNKIPESFGIFCIFCIFCIF